MSTELRCLILSALVKDCQKVCHELFRAIAAHALEPETSVRKLNNMRKDRPKYWQAIKAGKIQGQNADRIGIALFDAKVSDESVATAVDELILGDSINEATVILICDSVLGT